MSAGRKNIRTATAWVQRGEPRTDRGGVFLTGTEMNALIDKIKEVDPDTAQKLRDRVASATYVEPAKAVSTEPEPEVKSSTSPMQPCTQRCIQPCTQRAHTDTVCGHMQFWGCGWRTRFKDARGATSCAQRGVPCPRERTRRRPPRRPWSALPESR